MALGILAVSIAGAWGCAPPRTAENQGAPPELRLEGVRFRLFQGGEPLPRGSGTAAAITYQRDTTAVKATELDLHVRDHAQEVALTAPTATGIISARTFEASGGLLAVRGTDNAATESARFDPGVGSKGLVVGEAPVELWGRGYRLHGNGFTLDPTVGQIALRGGTRLVASPQGGR